MSSTETSLKKEHGARAIQWFEEHFAADVVGPLTSQFPGWPLPEEAEEVNRGISHLIQVMSGNIGTLSLADWLQRVTPRWAPLFKRIVLLYRRHRATETERLVEKTFHLRLTETLEEERKVFDAITESPEFLQIGALRLPRLNDFLRPQLVDAAALDQVPFAARQFDEKFHVLQAPQLFLQDLAYFRTKCEDRGTQLAIAFVDIDDFKRLNSRYGETKIDRNLLPRSMQTIEAHLFHHGYAYRQGGDEYLILLPSMSRALSISLLDEIRSKLAELCYPEITEKTTVSISLCVADADCPLTDRELLERANRAKQFAKENGKNRIATYSGAGLVDQDLEVATKPTV